MDGHVYDRDQPSRYALADHLDAERPAILAAYRARLEAIHSPLVGDPLAWPQVLAHADSTITDVVRGVRAGRADMDDAYKLLAWDIGTDRAARRLHPQASLRAATVLVEVVMEAATRHVRGREPAPELLGLVALALNESVVMRIHEASLAHSSRLLHEINAAHIEERRRIARDLHDRVGTGLGVAHQQLELVDRYRSTDPAKALHRLEVAHQAIQDTMASLRSITSDLRMDEPVHSLEQALRTFMDTIAPKDTRVRLRVNGDEAWASPAVRDEAFLIIREAVRNAVTHGSPSMLLVSVDIAPHELHATVEDDGRGFDPSRVRHSSGVGLASMRERAELLGGRVTVTTQVDRGTHMELVVPLSERRDG
ncbi:sensor histidine kinase [Thermoactinospora rubra]|uniref:sensor histidine kinase n=1 Tax=Thermoactinospora rubra TaxID=1088767 RepID=UPI000A0F7EBC|nr:ATP-binding protein [Thermoactinospora rubra]